MSANTDTTWTDAVSYARELIDPWARNDAWNECDTLSHELEETGIDWGDAFVEAASQLEADISDLLDVATYLAENPEYIGITDTELRALMGDDAPDSL